MYKLAFVVVHPANRTMPRSHSRSRLLVGSQCWIPGIVLELIGYVSHSKLARIPPCSKNKRRFRSTSGGKILTLCKGIGGFFNAVEDTEA